MGCLMVIMVFLSDIVTEDSLAENREICKHLSKVYFKTENTFDTPLALRVAVCYDEGQK